MFLEGCVRSREGGEHGHPEKRIAWGWWQRPMPWRDQGAQHPSDKDPSLDVGTSRVRADL